MVQQKKRKIDFQDGRHVGHLGFPIGTILVIFDLQVTPMLRTKFQKRVREKVQGVPQSQTAALPRHQEEEETDKAKQAQIEQTYEKHQVNWPFGSVEEAKNRFQYGRHWISDRNGFSYF